MVKAMYSNCWEMRTCSDGILGQLFRTLEACIQSFVYVLIIVIMHSDWKSKTMGVPDLMLGKSTIQAKANISVYKLIIWGTFFLK